MRLALALVCLSSVALADHAKMTNGRYPEKTAAWSKFTLKDIKLGTPLAKLAGFTCGPPPGTGGFATQDHSCVEFLDERCKGKRTEIHHLRSSADLPKGQTCFMDESNGATYLDRKFISPPLSAIRAIGTDTGAPLVYDIAYTFAADDLTSDSKLGKALVAKFGPPSYSNAPIGMSWTAGDVRLNASCRSTAGPTGEYCSLDVSDDELRKTEESIQEDADAQAVKQNAPTPPSF